MSKKKKNTIYTIERCTFSIDTNNLIDISLLETIFNKFKDDAISRLNQIISSIKFYVGGAQRHFQKKGFFSNETFEIDFHNRQLLFFLSPIFKLGFYRWKAKVYGALKRYIWESFCHEIIMTIIATIKINTTLIEEAKDRDLNIFNDEARSFVKELLEDYEIESPRIDFISINNQLWRESLPKKLGFLYVLYDRKLNQMRKSLRSTLTSRFEQIKFFNELRKNKMGYKYEYNLSELINYCLYSDHFEEFFRGSHWKIHSDIRREFYYKAKRIILKFFKENDIKLKEYKDSANRTHLFLSHELFEKVKSVCLQKCLQNLRNKYLDDYLRYKDFYAKCPICKCDNEDNNNLQKFYFSTKYKDYKVLLLKGMEMVDNLEELNTKDYFFGIPCESCYYIIRNIQGKYADLKLVQKFILYYSICPVCSQKNEPAYLLSFYYDDEREELRRMLLQKMILNDKYKKFHVNLGIPCCNCYESTFQEVPSIDFAFDAF
ncbi:MAG: hypothetical protein ACTSR8_11925 [Promethearchaeota archaeon]